MNDELLKLNIKMDHIMKIVCELFIMSKSNERLDSKLDQCIKLLNNLNSKIDNSRPNIPLKPPPLPIYNNNSTSIEIPTSNRDQLMVELKNKLKERQKN